MNRFFKPAAGEILKRPRDDGPDEPSKVPAAVAECSRVRSICCWNANSLLNRLKHNKSDVLAFLKSKNPDVLFISEVRMPARGPDNCKRDDGQPRVRGEFMSHDKKDREDSDQIKAWARESGYRMFVSLSDWRYAGVALLVKSTCEQVRHLSKVQTIDGRRCFVSSFAFSPPSCDTHWI